MTDRIETWVARERTELADLLAGLTPAQWATPTLCDGWTVHHLAAHLTTTTRVTWRELIPRAIRARGSFDRMEDTWACDLVARHAPDEIVELLRESAASTRRPPGAGPADPLVDLLVHGQDLTRPLGLHREVPTGAGIVALEHVADNWFYGRRGRGLRLVATDTDWSFGTGPEVRGTVADLLLAMTGRPAAMVTR